MRETMLMPVAVVLLPGPGDEDAAEGEGGEGHHKGGHRPETQRLSSDIGDDSWNSRQGGSTCVSISPPPVYYTFAGFTNSEQLIWRR